MVTSASRDAGARAAVAGAEHQHVARDPAVDQQRRGLQVGHEGGAAHLDDRGVAQIADAELSRHFVSYGSQHIRKNGVDVRRFQARVGNCRARRLQRQCLHAPSARLGVVGLADGHDAGLVANAAQVAMSHAGVLLTNPAGCCPMAGPPRSPKLQERRPVRAAQDALRTWMPVAQKLYLLRGRRRSRGDGVRGRRARSRCSRGPAPP